MPDSRLQRPRQGLRCWVGARSGLKAAVAAGTAAATCRRIRASATTAELRLPAATIARCGLCGGWWDEPARSAKLRDQHAAVLVVVVFLLLPPLYAPASIAPAANADARGADCGREARSLLNRRRRRRRGRCRSSRDSRRPRLC
jgi:hypothetical protein